MVKPGDTDDAPEAAAPALEKPVGDSADGAESEAAANSAADEADPEVDQRQHLLQNSEDGPSPGGDIEMNEIARVPEVQVVGAGGPNGDVEAGVELATAEPSKAVVATKSKAKPSVGSEFAGLTKEELEKFAKDPFWRRLRLILFALFWLVWLAMFAAVIVIIVLSPKCPPRQTRQFWQRPIYRLEVRSFAPDPDAAPTPNRAGSLAGLAAKVQYIRDLGINSFLLSSLARPQPGSGCPLDFAAMDPSLGSLDDLRVLTKRGRKKGFQLMMELDVSQADPAWKLGDGPASDPFVRDPTPFDRMLSRDGKPGWPGKQLRVPRSACASLNVSSDRVRQALFDAMNAWLDAGLSGFSLTNVAFMVPKKTNLIPDNTPPEAPGQSKWYTHDPRPSLISPEAAAFTRAVRAFIDAEAARRGRELALFVDFGDVAYPLPFANVSGSFGAHAVVHTGLGQPILPAVPPPTGDGAGLRAVVEAAIAAAASPGVGGFAWASNWAYLRRDASPALAVLGLTLPGTGLVYYGQELGMSHTPGYRLSENFTSYLSGADSTDPARSPMQWTGDLSNAGWLSEPSAKLAWAGNLSVRADDISTSNLRRLAASGHPASNLQLIEQLVSLATSLESLQWGVAAQLPNLPSNPNLVGFTRKAVRFPAVLVLVNSGDRAVTVDPSPGLGGGGGSSSSSGVLKLLHSWGGPGPVSSSHSVGKRSSFGQVFVPSRTALIFVVDE